MRVLRKIISVCLLLGLMAMCLFCAGCDSPQGKINFSQKQKPSETTYVAGSSDNSERPLRIAFASVMSPRETRQSYQQLVEYISEQLHRPAVLMQRRTYEELNMLMAGGDADIAFFSTGAYSAYRGMQPIELLAMVQTKGTIFYQAYLIAAKDSDIRGIDDLQGRVFAFTDPLSYSGRLAIDYLLLEKHITAEAYFQRCFYTYNHDKSIWAVANHLADAASVDSQIYEFALEKNPQLADKVRIIDVMNNAPTGPVVMRSDLSQEEKDKLREIFYKMGDDPSLHEAMQRAVIDKFVSPQPELYADLRHKYNMRDRLSGE
jgi:phosphonate transport system substrate-binding protein